MAEELFVDVRYQGHEFGQRVRMEEFASGQAYLHHPLPMPVGSTLNVEVADDLAISVRVARVSEQVAAAEKPPGMVVKPLELGERQQRWWDERVANTDVAVAIVEDLQASDSFPSEALEDTSARSVDTAASTAESEASSPEAVAAAMEATEEAAKGKKKKRRKKRPTKA